MPVTCEFCKKDFINKSNLIYHQKTAKYCLEIQEKEVQEEFVCSDCNKSFVSKYSFIRHTKSCQLKREEENKDEKIEKLEKEVIFQKEEIIKQKETIENLREQLRESKEKNDKLENHLMKLSERPTRTTHNTTNNNQRYNQIIQNLSPITQETLDELPSKLEDRHISQGPHGYVLFVQENFENKLVCTDIARKKLTFKDEKNNIITDINGKQITYKIFNSIRELREKLVEIKKSKAKTDLEKTQAVLYYGVEDAAIGKFLNMQEESVFSNKFISELSSKFYIKNIPLSKNFETEELENLELDDDIEYLVLSDG
jgi:hypothetical protein